MAAVLKHGERRQAAWAGTRLGARGSGHRRGVVGQAPGRWVQRALRRTKRRAAGRRPVVTYSVWWATGDGEGAGDGERDGDGGLTGAQVAMGRYNMRGRGLEVGCGWARSNKGEGEGAM